MNNGLLDRVASIDTLKGLLPILRKQVGDADAFVAAIREKALALQPNISDDELASLLEVPATGHAEIHTASLPTDQKPRRLKLSDGVLKFSDEPPPPRDFIIKDLLLAAKAVLLAGLGGVSKSQLLMQMSVSAAVEIPFMGMATKASAALLLLGEEDAQEVFRRINAIAKVLRLTEEQLDTLRKRVRILPMASIDMRLTISHGGSLQDTGFAQDIIAAARELEAKSGVRVGLIGLDHLGLIHGGDFNAREDAVQTMRLATYIGAETGAAVVVLAHSPKASIGKEGGGDVGDIAGSAAFAQNARGAYVLRTMDDTEGKRFGIDPDQRKDYVSLTNVKANYTAHGGVTWMKRIAVESYEVSVLQHAELREPEKAPKGGNFKLRGEIFNLVKEKPCLTKDNLLGFSGARDGRLRASKDTVRSEVELMLADGILAFRDPTDDERKRMGIKGKTNGFLTVTKSSARG